MSVYQDLLYKPGHECPHGNGDACECKLPRYRGLFAFRRKEHETSRRITLIVYARQAHDGGMIEFIDPETGENAGCCGIHMFGSCAWLVSQYADRFPVQEVPGEKYRYCEPRDF